MTDIHSNDTRCTRCAPATLATAKHGGCVQLGDGLPPLPIRQRFTTLHGETYAYSAEQMREYALAALSAQPSPGGQGEAREQFESWLDTLRLDRSRHGDSYVWNDVERAWRAVQKFTARQPVGEPVDDYESAFQEAEPPPLVVNAAGFRALESFLTVAEEFRRSTEPYIEAINEGGSAGDDEISEVFDRHLSYAKTAVSRSTVYAAPPAQAVDLPYSLDADPAGIRARVCDVITGTLMVGAQGHTPPPAGHWAEPFWKAARADAIAQAVDLAENMLSVLIEEGVLARNGRVFQKLRTLIDSQDSSHG